MFCQQKPESSLKRKRQQHAMKGNSRRCVERPQSAPAASKIPTGVQVKLSVHIVGRTVQACIALRLVSLLVVRAVMHTTLTIFIGTH